MRIYILSEIIVIVFALATGIICFLNPRLTIKIQQRFYESINWKIEPINMEKEIKNTRFMGVINISLGIGIAFALFKFLF